MARSRFRFGRRLGVILGALSVVALCLYGSACLVGPLPRAHAEVLGHSIPASPVPSPALPKDGASAITWGERESEQSTTAGITEPVPMGGVAKIVTALVVLDKHPLQEGDAGPLITVSREDFADYLRFIQDAIRAVSLIEGEQWTQREMMQAMLLASSNNHSNALARWAFGSIDGYLDAAADWLAQNNFHQTTVVDATGLAEDSRISGADAARLTALAFEHPVIAEIMAEDMVSVAGRRTVANEASYRANDGITVLSRSFTDQAGLCVLFRATVTAADVPVDVYAAFLREPDYDTLNADITGLLSSMQRGIVDTLLTEQDQPFARYTTAWGESVQAVATTDARHVTWTSEPIPYTVSTEPLGVSSKGTLVGDVTFDIPSDSVSVLLRTDRRVTDPGPLWRLTHPVPVLSALFDSLG